LAEEARKKIEPVRSVKGTRDLLPPETAVWQRVEAESRRIFEAYNFREIRTPVLEETALFRRSVGADTDIVLKEMFSFEDRDPVYGPEENLDDHLASLVLNAFSADSWDFRTVEGISKHSGLGEDEVREVLGRYYTLFRKSRKPDKHGNDLYTLRSSNLSLRPEATASVVRAYIEHSLFNEGRIQKLYYMGPMFRRERPQKGRFRQFYQIGAEVLGSDQPTVDVELLEMLALLVERLGLGSSTLLINSVGCVRCRPEYVKVLRQALEGVKSRLCADCQRRAVTNPLRVLDCKVEADQATIASLPRILDYLDPECRQHFEFVTAGLKDRGIAYTIEPRLVRGLDYYTRTTFEMTSGALGAQNALMGGGRYDGLAEMLGGPPTPGFGVAIGEDRLILAVEEAGALRSAAGLAAYIAWMGDTAYGPATKLARELRHEGLSVEMDYGATKLKKSLGAASKLGARFAIIVGEDEMAKGRYQVKDMTSGQQEEVEPARMALYLKQKVGSEG
jgi:histidyl-tRNA synthetase